MSSNTRPLAIVAGASRGIGYELAKLCAENGLSTGGSSRNEV
jgi:uncharacterized protein